MRQKHHTYFTLATLAFLGLILAIFFILRTDIALVTHPKGLIAQGQLDLIIANGIIMLLIIVPTFILLFWTAWKYHAKNSRAKFDLEHSMGGFGEVVLWIIPSIFVAAMAFITYHATYQLDPYKPIDSDAKPLKIQVVSIDWKWLFIYPEQGIATLNHFQIPEKTPIDFNLTADHAPMSSFWIPQLSGQIYSMTGMITQLHVMANEPGEYAGRAVEINGKGYGDMTFTAKSTSKSDFEAWVEQVKKSPLQLSEELYAELSKPSINSQVVQYSHVDKDLFQNIALKYMRPTKEQR